MAVFRTTVLQTGKTATGIVVPEAVVASLGQGKRPPVRVTINGYTYRNTVGTVSGRSMVSVSSGVRDAAHLAAGDEVEVEITLDNGPRVVPVPRDLAKALAKDATARRAFEQLSNSRKQRLTLPIEQAKTDETRQRRVGKAIEDLREGG